MVIIVLNKVNEKYNILTFEFSLKIATFRIISMNFYSFTISILKQSFYSLEYSFLANFISTYPGSDRYMN